MSEPTIADQFSLAADRHADRVAIWSEHGSISYRDLDTQSSALALWLQDHRKSRTGLLGVVLPKSIEAVVAIVAGLKANMPYAPVDPSWPQRRLESVFQQSKFEIVIAADGASMPSLDESLLLCPGTAEWTSATVVARDGGAHALPSALPDDLAYVLYTSGSTGAPKGVCVSNRAAHYFPNWARAEFHVDDSSRIASVAPFTFDLSTFDLFSGLCGGASVYLVPEASKMLPSSLSRFLEEHRITIIYSVPSNLGLLSNRGLLDRRNLDSLATVLFAGEVFPLPAFRKFAAQLPPHVQLYNLYGPTETNVCTYYDARALPDDATAIPIGRPLPGTYAFTIPGDDAGGNGEGELCIDGPGVMSGYWGKNNDALSCWTESTRRQAGKAYRTGDLTIGTEEGVWQYLGRIDNMVKIWGYRVELGEIESSLLDYPNVEQAAVLKTSKAEGFGDALVAFIVASSIEGAGAISTKDLLRHCKQTLPSYMVPQRILPLERMPLNDNGKIDRRRLADDFADMQGHEPPIAR